MHRPVISCPERAAPGEFFEVSLTAGRDDEHPNTPDHHIRWIMLYFLPDGAKRSVHGATLVFHAHGVPAEGWGEAAAYTHHRGTATMKAVQSGTIQALAYCTMHGLWESKRRRRVE